ncbi:hypothetical protein K504DRAFT_401317 [Pleomassaria siparia CBS 279.74]|uniref:Pentatricopeptide repeat protein-like protein n=1 Tax=Pleomassaria siparia CBS 279.74 TaxID=1314801 RepID=A0A6G1KI33_9PLEO|nr:hypothetical protein K504DRAFT_401317 [Pleomassaria siparia CBS 279.74]
MLNCRACLWRSTHALDSPISASASASVTARALVLLPRCNPTPPAFAFGQQRLYRNHGHGLRRAISRPPTEVDKLSGTRDEPWTNSTRAAGLRKRERLGLKGRPTRFHGRDPGARSLRDDYARRGTDEEPAYRSLGEGRRSDSRGDRDADRSGKPSVAVQERRIGRRDPSMTSIEWNRRRKELQYLSDPLELATFVKNGLRKDKATEMLQLVQMASHSMQTVVSWNHLIDYHLAKENVSKAMKIYNDMKKRAQFPDSYTYTILLRGLSINAHESGAIAKALSVYHSMFASNSRVEPSIIHTNAMLRVCSRAQDMDALWGVAAKIPETGAASANAITYVTILNAIRQSILVEVPLGETEDQVAARRERGLVDARRIWVDVITKWRNADLVIEEELVCAMGRLLLVGSRPRDWDDVLSLVEQTMDIPRLVPRLGSLARSEAGHSHLRAPNVPEQLRLDDDHLSPNNEAVRGEEFLAISRRGSNRSNPLTYATPSNNTLSMVQEACQKIVANKAATEYWKLFTDPNAFGIVPDINNMNFRLRLLRQNRASGDALRMLKESFIAKGITPPHGTFRIVMSTCLRDKNNHNAIKNASEVLGIMSTCMEDVDCKVVTMYAELANSLPPTAGPTLIDALEFLRPCAKNIRIQLGHSTAEDNPNQSAYYQRQSATLLGPERQDAIATLRRVYGLYDKLLNNDMIPEGQKPRFTAERSRAASFLHRLTYKDDAARVRWEGRREREGNWRGADKGETVEERSVPSTKWNRDGNVMDHLKDAGKWGERTTRAPEEKRKPWFSPRFLA